MIDEYREAKKVQGATESTLYEIALSLRNFERLVGKCNSKQITQNIINNFILQRGKEVKRPTLNKDIRKLKIFINWCKKKRYINNEIEIRELKVGVTKVLLNIGIVLGFGKTCSFCSKMPKNRKV
jgi:hypothetical protein